MNEQSSSSSIGLQKLSSISPAESSDINVDLDTSLITKMSDNSKNIKNSTTNNSNNNNNTSTKTQTNDSDDMDTDDATSPFNKANHADLINLASSNSDDIKTINRRSHSKSLFKSIFCCFSTSLHRNHGKSSSKTKNSSFVATSNFNNPCNQANSPSSNAVSPNSTSNNATTINNTTNTTTNDNDNTNIDNNNNNNNNKDLTSTDNSQTNSNGINNINNNSIVNNGNNLNNDKINSNNNGNLNNNNNNNNNYNTNNNNIDTSNGFQLSNYPYNLAYPAYRDNYQQERFLLPPVNPIDSGKKCLIIDLDETLVHSSFKQVSNADFIVPVEIDGVIHQVYVLKRPYVDEFLKKMGQLYECVLFTASLAKYADPVADLLDRWGVFRYRLFREACVYYRGNYVKDLSRLGRDLNKVIILDNSPASYIFHPNNAVPCISWFDDMNDTELNDLIPHFERLADVESVYSILKQSNTNSINATTTTSTTFSAHQFQKQPVVFTSSFANTQMNAANATISYDDGGSNQQVPSLQTQSVIYQMQQSAQSPQTFTNSNLITSSKTDDSDTSSQDTNNFNYLLNENKILLSIDLMMANKQQQQQLQQQHQQQHQLDQETNLEQEKHES